MAQVQCEYCDSFIKDTDPNCPNCGAVNKAYVRVTTDTPRTIAQLQEWYRARNLPPENVTRFFIGKNVHERRAFGIYQDGKDFIVYKNKDDGSRAVRYKGRDEAYAVNEIYMRLKQEIMNQKNMNSQRTRSAVNTRSFAPTRSTGRPSGCLKGLLTVVAMFVLFLVIGVIGVIEESLSPSDGSFYLSKNDDLYYYYGKCYDAPDSEAPYEWWISESGKGDDWKLSHYAKKEKFPKGVKSKNEVNTWDDAYSAFVPVWECENYIDLHHGEPSEGYYLLDGDYYYYLHDEYGMTYGNGDSSGWYRFSGDWTPVASFSEKDSVPYGLWYYPDSYRLGSDYESLHSSADAAAAGVSDFSGTSYSANAVKAYKQYVDKYHYHPSQGYYSSNGKVYYYLNDPYGAEYGRGDRSGWYTYGNSGWEYYCDYDDHSSLDDDLWYYPDESRVGYSYNDFYTYAAGEAWAATDFSDTTWYQEAEDAEDAWYDDYRSSSSSSDSSWSSDSDYDWDSGSSWDSGGSDWGSDW